MRANKDFISQLNQLLNDYEEELLQAKKQGSLTESTAKTYLLHSNNFAKWCKGDFVPGGRNNGIPRV
ncbi:MAG: hypothetical protein AB2421_21030 [Thermotaleaceae bacterium]